MAASPSSAPPMDYTSMAMSAAVSAIVAYGSYQLIGSQAAAYIGGGELMGAFIGLGITSVIGPSVVAAVSSQTSPVIPSIGKDMAMTFLYGGAIGTAVYYAWDMVIPQYSPGVDVAAAAAISGFIAPYLTFMPSY